MTNEWSVRSVSELEAEGILRVEDGNHGEYRPRPAEFSESGVAFVRAADISGGRVRFADASRINDVARARIRKGVGKDEDVLLTHKGTVGKVAFVPRGSPDFVCSPQTTFWRSLEPQRLLPTFLRYYLESPQFVAILASRSAETDMAPYVSLTEQRRFPVLLPPIETQRAIATTLGALDDKIESNRRAIDLAESLGDALFASSASGQAPISDIALLTMGSSPPGTSYNEVGEGIPFYQGVRDFGRRFPGKRVWTTAPMRLAGPNDTLVSVRAPVGSLNRAHETCCIGRGVAAVQSPYASTVYYALRAASELWEPFQQEGTVFGAINRRDLDCAKLPWPSSSQLKALEVDLTALDKRIASLCQETGVLGTLRDVLLPELLSGRLRVSSSGLGCAGVHPSIRKDSG